MRKLLILAAGATLLAAPAFAQTSAPSATGSSDSTQTAPTSDGMQNPGPTSTGVAQPSNANGSMQNGDMQNGSMQNGSMQNGSMQNGDSQNGSMQNGTTAAPDTGMNNGASGTRMYSATSGAGDVQVVSNGPIPDTAANRTKYRPLSNAGRHTKAAGN